MHWIVVYDFAAEWLNPFDWMPVAFVLVFVFAGILFTREGNWISGIAFVVVAGLMSINVFLHTLEVYTALSRAYHERTYKVAEGVVEHFYTPPCGSRHDEKFDVDGVHFFYGDAEIKMGFGQTVCWGGPMRGGLYVRIWYVDRPSGNRHIIRVEIRS